MTHGDSLQWGASDRLDEVAIGLGLLAIPKETVPVAPFPLCSRKWSQRLKP